MSHLYDSWDRKSPPGKILGSLHALVFPWAADLLSLVRDLDLNADDGTSRGISMCLGGPRTDQGYHNLVNLRELLKTQLPIEVFYIGTPTWMRTFAKNFLRFLNSKPGT